MDDCCAGCGHKITVVPWEVETDSPHAGHPPRVLVHPNFRCAKKAYPPPEGTHQVFAGGVVSYVPLDA